MQVKYKMTALGRSLEQKELLRNTVKVNNISLLVMVSVFSLKFGEDYEL